MNAPNLNDIRSAFVGRDAADEKMSQIRDLLVGDFVRVSEARLAAAESRIRELETGIGERLTLLQQRLETLPVLEARVRELEASIGERLTLLHQRIETLGADHTADRQAAFDELGQHVRDLGERIRLLSRS